MNKTIISILNKIEKNGFEAYIVGGFVRDHLLGHFSHDIDICTNALPKDLIAIFPNANSSAEGYGSIKLMLRKYQVEITTYRKEGNYQDRRPQEIVYIQNLIEDLSRRDFTINAMCMNKKGEIVDIFHGKEDLQHKVIRVIGDVEKKLSEDPLRILRAIRFATVLSFSLDPKIVEYILQHPHCIDALSKERKREELDKILLSKNVQRGMALLSDLNMLNALSLTYATMIPSSDICAMWAQLEGEYDYPFTKEEKKNIESIKNIVKYGRIDDNILYKYDLYLCISAGSLLGVSAKKVNEMYQNMVIHKRSDVVVTIQEIASYLNISFEEAREIESDMVERILSRNLPNEKKEIMVVLDQYKE